MATETQKAGLRGDRLEMAAGVLGTLLLLAVLSMKTGLDAAGWATGLGVGWTVTALLALGRTRTGQMAIFAADWITLTRSVLVAGVAGLVADSANRPLPVNAVVLLASVALALDWLDGQVARRTGTATPLGARFDGEVDAFLILLLSIVVAGDYGAWVLAIGAARYVFLVAGWVIPWMAADLPPRHWRKTVAAVQGIVLTIAASGVVPRPAGMAAVGVALLLLAESFGRDILWLYRTGAGSATRSVLRWTIAAGAGLVVWVALVLPDRLDRVTPAALVRIPIEGVVLVGVGLLLPHRPRRWLAMAAGIAFGLIVIVKMLNMGFNQELDRPFDPILDWGNLGPAVGVVRDSIGSTATDVALVLLGIGLALLITVVALSTVRVSTLTAAHRRVSARAVAVLAALWALSAALSLDIVPGAPVASTSAAGLVVSQVHQAEAALQDQRRFETAIHAPDPYAGIPASDLLTGLRGKDVILVFVESYGQVAVHGSTFAPGVDAVLRQGNTALARAGYSARSAYLNSPTFGGISWLAHSTVQSGLWVNNQQRFDQLMGTNRFTLTGAFAKAGWRTVSDIPSDDEPWQAGKTFYHFDKLYNRLNVGYHGPVFSYAAVPDQYTYAAFQRNELGAGHRPVMAEIDTVSSHIPWTPLPRMVPWDRLGNGSIYDPMPGQGLSPSVAWRNEDTVRKLYGESIQYSMRALVSWVTHMNDRNLVLVLMGDHQPT
ncbi:MAG TPA: CDP-alcohol phosphatidyltransferase family protein, partial [Gaiellales bacterium]|nr:CDP-alcohol phosphatidyltransferase family protein [Gaiellales bacterium]